MDTGEGFRDTFEVLSLSEWENSTVIYMSIKWVFIAIMENARIFNGQVELLPHFCPRILESRISVFEDGYILGGTSG